MPAADRLAGAGVFSALAAGLAVNDSSEEVTGLTLASLNALSDEGLLLLIDTLDTTRDLTRSTLAMRAVRS